MFGNTYLPSGYGRSAYFATPSYMPPTQYQMYPNPSSANPTSHITDHAEKGPQTVQQYITGHSFNSSGYAIYGQQDTHNEIL
ncbi:hypothetical protein GYMLUDRAFT_77486 [Collybiopsis luxurians FD-317 M1]|uniref:Uncharacterized protein n=1 Tax=Collybiopsis luxurians FD-317 M1 TaxID=944289 RepID=A0A0D0ASL0_9AGAR|nr:hypothetical protein GYMLUDRAFT_77486 [Collybiopsis luxurians FD-317 M1]